MCSRRGPPRSNPLNGLRVLFFGTPAFAVPTLKRLDAECDVVGVVTQPDRPTGRGRSLKPQAVKVEALELGIPVFQPDSLKSEAVQAKLASFQADVFVVAAYGRIMPQAVLDMPRFGPWNIHGSLLPAYRGAAPIQRAVMDGLTETGVGIMRMEAGLDTGPVAAEARVPISSADTSATMFEKLAELGAELLIATLPKIVEGRLALRPQDGALATHAARIQKAEGFVDLNASGAFISALVRGLDPGRELS